MKTKIVMALLAGSALFAACKGSGNYSADDSLAKQMIDSPKIIKTADMRIKVKDVATAEDKISKLIGACGGTVVHHNRVANIVAKQDIELPNDSLKKLTVYSTTADLILKIPSGFMEPFMDSLNRMGMFIEGRKMDIEDKTLDYISTKMKANNRVESVKLRRTKIKLTQRAADSILTLKDDVVDKQISNLRTNQAVIYSTLTLSLYQNNTVTAEVVANDDLSTYKTPLSVRVGSAFSNGWYYASELIVVVLHFWVLLLAGSAVWLGIYFYKRNKTNVGKTSA